VPFGRSVSKAGAIRGAGDRPPTVIADAACAKVYGEEEPHISGLT